MTETAGSETPGIETPAVVAPRHLCGTLATDVPGCDPPADGAGAGAVSSLRAGSTQAAVARTERRAIAARSMASVVASPFPLSKGIAPSCSFRVESRVRREAVHVSRVLDPQVRGDWCRCRRRAPESALLLPNPKIGHSPGTPPSRRGAPLPEGLSVSQSPVAPRRATAVSCPGFSCRYGAAQRYQGLTRKWDLSRARGSAGGAGSLARR